jgi:hypothetical protein
VVQPVRADCTSIAIIAGSAGPRGIGLDRDHRVAGA